MAKIVEDYWTGHTVNDIPFTTEQDSLTYLQWRSDVYPLAYEMLNLYGQHEGQTVLDFGCGPGNDIIGFAVETKAKRIIGIDVSPKALRLARGRVKLHNFARGRIKLKLAKDNGKIDLPDKSVHHVNCQGVLHHISKPQSTLDEFYRVLKPGGTATIMVYNYDSLYLHLYVAYSLQVLDGKNADLPIKVAFSRNTDGEDCPIAYPYKPAEFIELCTNAGFKVQYKGGYFAELELSLLNSLGLAAINDERLGEEHREFLRTLGCSEQGYPLHDMVTAGVGGVYLLTK